MTFRPLNRLIPVFFFCLALFATAQTVDYIQVAVEPPFEYPDSYWGPYDYRWAYNVGNYIHIESKPSTVKRFLPFDVGDNLTDQLACETERRLRCTQFFGEAAVRLIETDSGNVAHITVQDLWTTKLSPSLSYEGRVYEWAIEFEEVNLLGYGVGVSGRYRHDEDYDSWHGSLGLTKMLPFQSDLYFSFTDATKLIGPTRTAIGLNRDRLSDCDPIIWRAGGIVVGGEYNTWLDGHIRGPSYTADDHYLYFGAKYIFGEKIGIGAGFHDSAIRRVRIGEDFPDAVEDYKRDLRVVTGGVSLVRRDFYTAEDVDAFGRTEDIPYGVAIGLEGGAGPSDMAPYARFSGTIGIPVGPVYGAFACHFVRQAQTEAYSASMRFFSEKFLWSRFYGRFFYGTVSNSPPESFYRVGGQTSLRSYQTNMQTGNRTLFGNLEYRLFTPYEFFSVRMGACAFLDFGAAWDTSQEYFDLRNIDDRIIGDYGIELRFGSTSSTTGQIMRVSVARTFDNLWELELSSGQLFDSYLNLDHRVPLP